VLAASKDAFESDLAATCGIDDETAFSNMALSQCGDADTQSPVLRGMGTFNIRSAIKFRKLCASPLFDVQCPDLGYYLATGRSQKNSVSCVTQPVSLATLG